MSIGNYIHEGDPLSKRELQVLELIVKGLSNHEAAKELNISHRTVETHRRHMNVKIGTKRTAGLVCYWYENNAESIARTTANKKAQERVIVLEAQVRDLKNQLYELRR